MSRLSPGAERVIEELRKTLPPSDGAIDLLSGYKLVTGGALKIAMLCDEHDTLLALVERLDPTEDAATLFTRLLKACRSNAWFDVTGTRMTVRSVDDKRVRYAFDIRHFSGFMQMTDGALWEFLVPTDHAQGLCPGDHVLVFGRRAKLMVIDDKSEDGRTRVRVGEVKNAA